MLSVSVRLPLAPFLLDVELTTRARVLAVLGPSGSGKTSLLACIAGLRRPAGGRIEVDGRLFYDGVRGVFVAPERRAIGYVPQGAALFPHLSVADNIRFAGLPPAPGNARTGRREAESERLAELSTMFELAPLFDRNPLTLSGGEKQRVALARALYRRPTLLLLDEPLGSLDVSSRDRIAPYLRRIQQETSTRLIYVTHDMAEAAFIAEEAVVLDAGRIRRYGPTISTLASLQGELSHALETILRGHIATVHADQGTAELVLDAAEANGEPPRAPTSSSGGAPGAPVRVVVPHMADLAPGSSAAFRLRAEDVLLSPGPPGLLSARNVVEARVTAVEPRLSHALVRALAGETAFTALITGGAVRQLELSTGSRVWLVFKTHALERVG